MILLTILLILALGHIVYTDFKEYKISIISVFIACITALVRMFLSLEHAELMQILLLNLLFTMLIVAVLYTYCQIRKVAFFKAFGLGDLLFLLIAIISFAPFSFVLYVIVSSFLGVVYFALQQVLNSKRHYIPFAGIMAFLLLLLLGLDLSTGYSTYIDNWFLKL